MALDNLSNLKAEMQVWAGDRPDLAPRFQDCIDMTTNDLNKVIRSPKQHAEVVLVLDENGKCPLPDDYLEWRNVFSVSNPRMALGPLTPEGMIDAFPHAHGGIASHFAIVDEEIAVMPLDDEVVLQYWMRIPHLVEGDGTDTNWLLIQNANLYLYGAMKYVEVFKRNAEGAQMFGGLYNGLIDAMMRENKRSQWSRLRMRVAGRSTP